MHALWNFFIDRRQFTLLLIGALVVAGFASVVALPKESAPEVDVPIAVVSTTLRGASPEDVAQLVTKEIEKEVATVANIDTLSSSSREGISIVTAEFDASADLDKSIEDVKDAVDRAKVSLPRDADEPVVVRINFADQPILMLSLSGGLPAAEFDAVGREVQDELEQVFGVSRVEISGNREREAQVILRREALAAYGISFAEAVAAISSANASVPVGAITVDDVQYAVNFHGSLTDPADLSSIVVRTHGGAPVYLSDVADIVDGIERPSSIARVSQSGAPAAPAINVLVYKQTGGDITRIVEEVRERLTQLQTVNGTLDGIDVLVTYDAGEEVNDSLTELTRVGLETIALVLLCLFLTIGWRESVVAGLSIPLSFVIAFIGLYASGNTINFVSLFSLILAIGILVDSGIVVTEAIHTRYKKLGDPVKAAKEAIREYAWPLIAGTMTTVAVFVPLFFISGITGEFIKSIPFTIIFVLFASLVVALGFVPLIAILFTKREMNALERRQEHWNEAANRWYREWLSGVLDNRRFQRWFLRGTALAFVIALILPMTGLVKVIFFPGENVDFLYIDIEEKHGTPLERTDLSVRAVEEILYGHPDVESFATTVGGSSAFNQNGSQGGGKYANITVNLHPEKERSKTSTEILVELQKELANFTAFDVRAYEPSGGPPTGAPIVVKFTGENLDDLSLAADLGERVLAETPGTRDIVASNRDDSIGYALTIDRAKAAQVGLSPAAVAQTLRTAVSGTVATTIVKDEGDIDVLVLTNLNDDWREPSETADATIDALENLSVPAPGGQVLLGSLIESGIERASAVITREDQKNIVTVSSYLAPGGNAINVSNEFKTRMAAEQMPAGVVMSLGGETEEVDQSFREMFYALIAGMVLMLGLLVLEFNSFRYSFYLLMLIPLSLIGVFAGLLLTFSPLSFPSLLGVIALSGVIINHAIILVDSMIVRMKNAEGRTLKEVIVDAAASRLRPIVLTTITTVVGMIPLSAASSLWGPLAFAIMFGLAFAMILTLVLTPILIYRHPGKQYWDSELKKN
jgi:multidrug efflux pump subunit AcrB